jgi:hypothetical protein
MSELAPIIIGDTFERSYTFYNPIEGTSEADLDNPVILTGITITFHVKTSTVTHIFTISTGVTVTPVSGLVDIALTPTQTALFTRDSGAESWLLFTYPDGSQKTKVQQKESVLRRDEVQ